MYHLNKEELLQTQGGAMISGTVLNAMVNIIKILMEAGRSVGSAFRRIGSNQMCPLG